MGLRRDEPGSLFGTPGCISASGPAPADEDLLTRRGLRSVMPDRNQVPAKAPSGLRSHAASRREAIGNIRARTADPARRRRSRGDSGKASTMPSVDGVHPARRRTMVGARRPFSSSFRSDGLLAPGRRIAAVQISRWGAARDPRRHRSHGIGRLRRSLATCPIAAAAHCIETPITSPIRRGRCGRRRRPG